MTLMILALALAGAVTPDVPPSPPSPPKETVIRDAGNGGIRNFQQGPAGSSIVFLQDRTQRWYRVTLSGPCVPDRSLQTILFRTDATGTFDRFSQIASRRYPGQVCGVRSIVASPPPPGQPGASQR